jgi:uncharacterized protein
MSITNYGAPGVYVTESLLAPSPVPTTTSPSTAGFAGEHYRGPTGVAILCNSWNQFVQYYGGFNPNPAPVLSNTWLPYAVFEFFNNGGVQCYINRIAASANAGVAASATFTDNLATSQNTLRLTAGFLGVGSPFSPNPYPNVGSWGNSLYAQIVTPQSNTSAGTFNLIIYFGGTSQGNVVETWNNLSMNPQSTRYAPTVLNSSVGGSLWVIATDLFSPAFPPLNNPIAQGPTQLTGGVDTLDPSVADRQNAWTYGNAASAFDAVNGVLNLNAPGETNSSVLSSAITYASGGTSGRPYSFLVVDPAQGVSVATAVSYMQTLQGLNNSSFAALYYPWVSAVNPASPSLQANITMPPGGFVLGQMASVDTLSGAWYAPAGTQTVMNGVVATERVLSPGNYATLNQANINALKTLANGQVIIWGARTFLTQLTDVYVPIRRTLNYVEASLSNLLTFAVFQPNDALLWATITATCTQFLGGMAGRNAFQGQTQAQQFFVICNTTNNTNSTIQQGIVNTTIGLALNYPAEFIQLNVQQFQSSGVTTTQITTI